MRVLLENSDILAAARKQGTLRVIGAIYDVDSGRVEFLDDEGATPAP
jgi:carbonic anhydrase